MFTRLTVLLFLLVAGVSSASGQNCLDYGPVVSLNGRLSSRVFAGPPNYESIKRGDRKETAIILTLANATCMNATSVPENTFNIAEPNIREVQLVITKPELWKALKRLRHKPVVVSGTLFHAHTGHHRTEVLTFVSELKS